MDALEDIISRLGRADSVTLQRAIELGDLSVDFVARVPKRFISQIYLGFRVERLTKEILGNIRRTSARYAASIGYGFFKNALVVPIILAERIDSDVIPALEQHSANAGVYEIPVVISTGRLWLRRSLRSDTNGLARYNGFRKVILNNIGSEYQLQN